MCFFSSPHSLIQESKGHGAPHRQHFIMHSIRAYKARYEDVMTNCHLGHMFYETCTPFNHVYCPAQTLRFSPIVHRVQDYIGSAVVERRVQAASNVSRKETSRACRQNNLRPARLPSCHCVPRMRRRSNFCRRFLINGAWFGR